MPRLFVGVPLPDVPALAQVQDGLRAAARGVKFVDLAQGHVTLKFLGSVPEHRVPVIDAAVADAIAPFARHAGRLVGVGAFPSERKARVVWAGITDTQLPEMAKAVDRAIGRIGFARENRAFKAHVTLARLRDPADVMGAIEPWREHQFGPVPVDRVVLFESVLGAEGPTYTARGVWPLPAEVPHDA